MPLNNTEIPAVTAAIISRSMSSSMPFRDKSRKREHGQLSESLTDEVLKQQMYEKWNGELPKVTGGDTMIGLDNLD